MSVTTRQSVWSPVGHLERSCRRRRNSGTHPHSSRPANVNGRKSAGCAFRRMACGPTDPPNGTAGHHSGELSPIPHHPDAGCRGPGQPRRPIHRPRRTATIAASSVIIPALDIRAATARCTGGRKRLDSNRDAPTRYRNRVQTRNHSGRLLYVRPHNSYRSDQQPKHPIRIACRFHTSHARRRRFRTPGSSPCSGCISSHDPR